MRRKIDNTGTPVPHLRAWRKAALLSQKQLGHLAGVSKYTIMNIEIQRYQGTQNLVICKIAYALGITPAQLLYEQPKKHVPGASQSV